MEFYPRYTRDGSHPTAAELNKITTGLERQSKLWAAPPIYIQDGPGGTTFTFADGEFWAVVCCRNNDGSYQIFEVALAENGVPIPIDGGRTGSCQNLSPDLLNVEQLVRVYPGFNGQYICLEPAYSPNPALKDFCDCPDSSSSSSSSSESSESSEESSSSYSSESSTSSHSSTSSNSSSGSCCIPPYGCGLHEDEEGRLCLDYEEIAGNGLEVDDSGDCPQLAVKPYCHVVVTEDGVSVNPFSLAGDGLKGVESECGTLAIDTGCGVSIHPDSKKLQVELEDFDGDGLKVVTPGAGCKKLAVDTGCGVKIDAGKVALDYEEVAGKGLEVDDSGDCEQLTVKPSCHIDVTEDGVAVALDTFAGDGLRVVPDEDEEACSTLAVKPKPGSCILVDGTGVSFDITVVDTYTQEIAGQGILSRSGDTLILTTPIQTVEYGLNSCGVVVTITDLGTVNRTSSVYACCDSSSSWSSESSQTSGSSVSSSSSVSSGSSTSSGSSSSSESSSSSDSSDSCSAGYEDSYYFVDDEEVLHVLTRVSPHVWTGDGWTLTATPTDGEDGCETLWTLTDGERIFTCTCDGIDSCSFTETTEPFSVIVVYANYVGWWCLDGESCEYGSESDFYDIPHSGPYATEGLCEIGCFGSSSVSSDSCTGWYCCEATEDVVFLGDCAAVEEYECAEVIPGSTSCSSPAALSLDTLYELHAESGNNRWWKLSGLTPGVYKMTVKPGFATVPGEPSVQLTGGDLPNCCDGGGGYFFGYSDNATGGCQSATFSNGTICIRYHNFTGVDQVAKVIIESGTC